MANVESYKDAGNKYFKNEDYSKAIKCYKEGLELDPGNATLNCNLAQAYLAVKEFAEAEVHAVVTLALQGDSVKGFYRATKAALGLSKKERALSYLRIGLLNCPKAEELRVLYEEITKEYGDSVSSGTIDLKNTMESVENKEEEDQETPVEKDKDTNKENCTVKGTDTAKSEIGGKVLHEDQGKQRSRSTSSHKGSSSKKSKDKVIVRSTSVNRSSNDNSILKRPVSSNSDEFIDTLLKVQSELTPDEKSPQLREREAMMEKKKKLETYMREGTEAFDIKLPKQASEKYKCALDIMSECNIEIFGLSEIDRIVLKYSLSICWIETRNYNSIVQSIGSLTEIEATHSSDLPAVFYGLGQAFYRLNRFKVALQHLGKGVQVIESNLNIIPHRWPGTMNTITETTNVGFKESIEKLVHECRTYRESDAVCRYDKCLTVSPHICPSEVIFCSDPDFVGYVVIICQENCRIMYHVGCWKLYKENMSSVGKLTDKDMLGQACLTSDCLTEGNEISVIVRIEVYGDDGKIKTSCSKEPTRTDNVNEHRKEKKKKNEKTEKPIKAKPARPRVRKLTPTTANTTKKVKRKGTISGLCAGSALSEGHLLGVMKSSEELAACIQRLEDLRKINFGLEEAMPWNPQSNYFGRQDIAELKTYLNPQNSKDSETLRERKDFIFTYFYEYLNDEGPQKISVIEKKWQEEVVQFQGINEFMSQHDGMCDFLLQSYRFACIDDYLCLVDQLADTYNRVQDEVGESLAFILNNTSLSIETESEVDNSFSNKFDDKLEKSITSNNIMSDSHSCEQTDSVAADESELPADVQSIQRQSPCDLITQEESDISYDDLDYEITDSEYEYNYENENTEINSNIHNVENEIDDTQKNFLASESTSANFDKNTSPNINIPSCSKETLSTNVEIYNTSKDIQHSEDQQSRISDVKPCTVAVQSAHEDDNQVPTMKNAVTQTDNYHDLVKEIESLNAQNVQLKEEAIAWNNEKQSLILSFQRKTKDYEDKMQMVEDTISGLVIETEKNKKDFEREITAKNTERNIMKKKYEEQIDTLSKKKEADIILLKKNLESMTELSKEVEKQTNIIIRLEGQLRKSNEQVLNIRKLFGEFKLDSYLGKCRERLTCMNAVTKYVHEASTTNFDVVKNAIDAWEAVARQLQDTRDLLQVQYDILSQQLKNKVSSDCLLQLELSELPKEPHYPLQDMDDIICIALEYIQHKKPEQNGKNMNEILNNNHNPTFMNQSSAYTSSFPTNSSYQSTGELYGMAATNSYGYKNPFFPNHYSGLRPMTNSHVSSPFRPLSPNERLSTMTRTWSTEFSAPALRMEKPEQIAFGDKLSSGFSNSKTDLLSNHITVKNHSSQSSESMSSGESEFRGTTSSLSETKELPFIISDTKHSVFSSEKKNNSSCVSGLTPIEVTKSTSEIKTSLPLATKPIITGIRQFFWPRKHWNYQKLLEELQKNFKVRSEAELSECLFIIREKNGNKLSGLSVSIIIHRVEKLLDERSNRKVGNMGMDKFGETAWGEVKEKDVSWQNDDMENECIICHVNMENNKTNLQCKHSFHTECIRKWLHTNSTCPICRKYTRLVDEFPPLA